MGEKKSDRIAKISLTLTEVSEATGKPLPTVHDWTKAGLASVKQGRARMVTAAALIRYLAAREYQPGSQRERLAMEQADKVALENAAKRGELVYVDHVEYVLSSLAASLAAQLDALPGRMAGELAGINEPGVIRARLLEATRSIRSAVAQAVEQLAQPDAADGDAVGDPDATEEPDGGSVG